MSEPIKQNVEVIFNGEHIFFANTNAFDVRDGLLFVYKDGVVAGIFGLGPGTGVKLNDNPPEA